MRLAAAGAAAAAAIVAAGALAWPGGGPERPRAEEPFDGVLAGAPLQRATCEHWRAAPPEQRLGTIHALTDTIGGASTSGGYGTTLGDAAAGRLFDRVCSTPSTGGFALYLIYARAAAFSRRGAPPGT